MLRSTLGVFLPPFRPAHTASESDSTSAFSCLRLKDLREEGEKEMNNKLELRTSHYMLSNRDNSRRKERNRNCSSSVVETTNTSAVTTSSSSGFPVSFATLTAPSSMWQEAMKRKQYLLDRAGVSGEVVKGGAEEKRNRSPDWLYESYYCMSQQHPLIVFLLLIVMGACLALLTVFFASGLNIEDHVAFVITVPTALAIFLTVFVLVCIESVFKKLLRVFSLVIWACLVAMGYLFMFSGGIVCPWDQVRNGCT
ncbi:hypothetical protein XENORESO_009859 [Xenotaenia resolanae]|uniref:Adenylate cyclase type 2 n=1 Tax=Xenotaenia resolanae TaxID=208358 RepID=A0ABV0WRX5_9TELE